MTSWEDNSIQFPRLLAEIQGIVTEEQMGELSASMDLEYDDIRELFDRAILEWEAVKLRTLGPKRLK